jgi:DNA-binding Lrp family transcriptional regulator
VPVVQLKTLLSADERLIYQILSGNKKMSSTEMAEVTRLGKTKVVSLMKSLTKKSIIEGVSVSFFYGKYNSR